jgi:hypothetical protein
MATTLAMAAPLPSNRNIDIQMSNDAGAIYGSGPNDTYFIDAPGGGLNQLHITSDSTPGGVSGQLTAKTIGTSSASGGFLGIHDRWPWIQRRYYSAHLRRRYDLGQLQLAYQIQRLPVDAC